jgi:hypothetical protein
MVSWPGFAMARVIGVSTFFLEKEFFFWDRDFEFVFRFFGCGSVKVCGLLQGRRESILATSVVFDVDELDFAFNEPVPFRSLCPFFGVGSSWEISVF